MELTYMKQSLPYSIIVMSSDGYSDLWKPFAQCFNLYWPTCRADIHLVTQTKTTGIKLFKKIHNSDKNALWTRRLFLALKDIKAEFVIILLEDYFLCHQVDDNTIEHYVELAKKHKVGCLKLFGNPNLKNRFSLDEQFVEYVEGTLYRINTQVSIWNKNYLLKIIQYDLSAWDFERIGSKMSERYKDKIIGTVNRIFHYEDAVHRGKIEKAVVKLCERNGFFLDTNYRRQMSDMDYIIKHIKNLIHNVWFPKIAPNLIAIIYTINYYFKKLK